jgi:hypothetical protein
MTDTEFQEAFESGALPPEEFHHRDHVRLAWLYLRQEPLLTAIERFTAGLRCFAARAGKPERYHETVTWAYLLLIHERMRSGSADTFDAFLEANADLVGDPSPLTLYYRGETLASDFARRVFVMPDRSLDAPVQRRL